MEIVNNSVKLKCDIPGCKNMANYSLICTDNKKHNLNFCASCVENMNKQFCKILTPKSIKNIYQKGGTYGKAK